MIESNAVKLARKLESLMAGVDELFSCESVVRGTLSKASMVWS